jgi:hypothetical protein
MNDDLKAAAERATPGEWSATGGDVWHEIETLGHYGPERAQELLANASPDNAHYIALASPARILSILAELDRKTAALERIKTLEWPTGDNHAIALAGMRRCQEIARTALEPDNGP